MECDMRCPKVETVWNNGTKKCDARCPKVDTVWNNGTKKCDMRCQDEATVWNNSTRKCDNRCKVSEKYVDGKCIDRCNSVQLWDNASQKCKNITCTQPEYFKPVNKKCVRYKCPEADIMKGDQCI